MFRGEFFSTMSSGLNSLAAVIWEDMVKPMSWSSSISEGRQVKPEIKAGSAQKYDFKFSEFGFNNDSHFL